MKEPMSVAGLPEPLRAPLVASLGRAFLFARRIVGEAAMAEDAVQEACLRYIHRPPLVRDEREAASYFLRVVHGVSVNLLRNEKARERREEKAMELQRESAVAPDRQTLDREALAAARAEIDLMPRELREAVCLCCETGLTHREAAEVVGVPLKTMSDRVGRALERLRRALTASGFAAVACGELAKALAASSPPEAPAALVGSVHKLIRETPAGKPAAMAASSATLKGGIIVKIGLGLAAISMAAGATLWAVTGNTGENAASPPPAQAPRKFATPVTDPSAEWQLDARPWAGVQEDPVPGVLDGPRQEIMWRRTLGAKLFSGITTGDRYVALSYDEKSERYFTTAGGARGCLDGPFSRARFGGQSYSQRMRSATSPDGRYVYFTEPCLKDILRRLDFARQEVVTMPFGDTDKGPMAVDKEGNLYIVKGSELIVMDVEGKVARKQALDMQEKFGNLNASIALDEVHGKIYGAGYGMKNWYIFYWDVKDGSFHGVLPIPKPGEPSRGKPGPGAGIPGPFKGTALYGEGDVAFGPDDPEKNFLYTGRVDTRKFFRLDLKAEWFWACSREKGGTVRFIREGTPGDGSGYGGSPRAWLSDGSFLHSPEPRGGGLICFRRVK